MNGKRSGKRRKSYLMRLAVTMLCVLVIPFFFIVVFFWSRSSKQIEETSRAYYEGCVSNFSNLFEQYAEDLRSIAKKYWVNSKSPLSDFYDAGLTVENDSFVASAFQQKCQQLQLQSVNASEIGFLFCGRELVINKLGAVSQKKYEEIYLQTDLPENEAVWDAYLEQLAFKVPKFAIMPVREEDGRVTALFCYSATFGGGDGYPLIVSFQANEAAFSAYLGKRVSGDAAYYVIDAGTETVVFSYGSRGAVPEEIFSGSGEKLYRVSNPELGLDFVMVVSEDSIQENLQDYQGTTALLGLIFGVLLLAMAAVALFYEYRPVQSMIAGLDLGDENEFQSIQRALELRNERIEEQEMVIMDSLLNHLINGTPFSKAQDSWIPAEPSCYRVYVLERKEFYHAEQEAFRKQALSHCGSKVFISDLPGHDKYVLIVFVKKERITAFDCWIRQELDGDGRKPYTLLSGQVVSELNEIRRSYLSCYHTKDEKAELKKDLKEMSHETQHPRSQEKILSFIDGHFTDTGMCQTMVAGALNISTYTVSRLFKSQLGVGFSEYVNRKRLEYAGELLKKERALSISEISVMVGFENARYFSKIFKECYGVTPSEYMEKAQLPENESEKREE